ncbi:flagellar basal-body MS-ring/collar protein FliF [Pseudorhodoferax sp. Leaf265]|uniref:flagellar basal-body MS-ring/collar protein FliF n=1 Tax=Pseudorhodoferax sp. Leaf265 TaxID=1736315 RepID=UPI0006FDC454|nr:flagellar MS-ring protein [Pseudorhodoferax sp. Leaf265]PZQ03269.1 MAG: flagellar M-ring protein FliF [Variovorax paradoxus]PZQ17543.1 MAG: flagellar M-ring protein FliF [Variovorax paradoxus]
MIATLKAGVQNLRNVGMPTLPAGLSRSLLPILLLAVGLTAVVMMLLWRDEAGYKPVFGARERIAASDMMAVLDAEGVPYRLHPDSGQVLVPGSQLGRVRMLLAAKGVTAQLPAGLELMDKSDPLGVSQFVQDVRFRRGLEGELAQSIRTLDAVESARVHLSMPRSTSFVLGDGEKASASVVLALKPGRKLAPEQIAAIVNMVAGSVSSLDVQRVSLVDQAGNLLSSRVDLSQGFDAVGGGDAARRHQDATLANVRELLGPVVGLDNFKASVTAEVREDRIDETVEKLGDNPRITSEAVRDEQDRSQAALGVPGSLSNRPPPPANPNPNAQAQANAQNAGNDATARRNATTRQYAYDRQIRQIRHARGQLARLNVAVVLNNAAAPGGNGWSAEDLTRIEGVLRNGLGIDAERGDKLAVSALAFTAPPEMAPWWKQPDRIYEYATPVAWLLGGLLAYFLLARPLLRSVQQHLAPKPATPRRRSEDADTPPLAALTGPQAAPSAMAALPPAAGAQIPVVPLLEDYDLPPPGSPVDVMVNHLRVLAAKEPERVAEVVKQWVQKHGRPE